MRKNGSICIFYGRLPDLIFGATWLLIICFFRGARREAPGTPEKKHHKKVRCKVGERNTAKGAADGFIAPYKTTSASLLAGLFFCDL